MQSDSDRQQTRDLIFLEGIRVFVSHGYHAAKVEDIVRAARISRPTFYAHFKNKEHLFTQIVDTLLDEQSRFILGLQQDLLTSSADLVGLIDIIVATILKQARQYRESFVFYFNVIPGSGTQAEERFRRAQKTTLNHFMSMLRGLMEAQGYEPSAAFSLTYMFVGGLTYVARQIIDREMSEADIEEFVKGMKALLADSRGS